MPDSQNYLTYPCTFDSIRRSVDLAVYNNLLYLDIDASDTLQSRSENRKNVYNNTLMKEVWIYVILRNVMPYIWFYLANAVEASSIWNFVHREILALDVAGLTIA